MQRQDLSYDVVNAADDLKCQVRFGGSPTTPRNPIWPHAIEIGDPTGSALLFVFTNLLLPPLVVRELVSKLLAGYLELVEISLKPSYGLVSHVSFVGREETLDVDLGRGFASDDIVDQVKPLATRIHVSKCAQLRQWSPALG